MSTIDSTFLAEEKMSAGPSSSRKSSKRKSFENSENIDTNQIVQIEDSEAKTAKKVKVLQPLQEGSDLHLGTVTAPTSTRTTTTRSALPRYQTQRKLSSTTSATTTSAAPAAAPRTTAKTVASVPSNPQPREKASNMRGAIVDPSTPGKSTESRSVAQHVDSVPTTMPLPPTTPRISNNPFLRKLQREILAEVTGTYLSTMFDNSFGFIDERVNTTMGSLKVKSKWDVKEKMKRQESVVKELKDIVALIQDGIKSAKASSHDFEQKAFLGLRESYDHLVDDAQIIATLRNGEKKLIKDNDNLAAEIKALNAKMEQVKAEFSGNMRKVETNALLTEKENEMLKERLSDAEKRAEKLRKDHEESVLEHKSTLDKVNTKFLHS